ncbi:MAG: hypothetical protein AAGF11_41055 [Myxococcota bacterium]
MNDDGLDPLLAATRDHLDAMAASIPMPATPPIRSRSRSRSRSPARLRRVLLPMAAAAVLVVGAGLVVAQTLGRSVTKEVSEQAVMSVSSHERAASTMRVTASGPDVHDTPKVPATVRDEPEAPVPLALEPTDEGEDAGEIEGADARSAGAEQTTSTPAPTVSNRAPDRNPLARQLQALDDEAQAAWAAGDTGQAAKLFRRMIAIGGRSGAVQLAYGDLMSIARSAGDDQQHRKLQRAYIRKFPRGRFADDVRAQLCRDSTGEAARKCWTAYLRDLPKGDHAEEAARIAGSGP